MRANKGRRPGCEADPEESKHGEELYRNAGGGEGRYVIDSSASRSSVKSAETEPMSIILNWPAKLNK